MRALVAPYELKSYFGSLTVIRMKESSHVNTELHHLVFPLLYYFTSTLSLLPTYLL